MEDPVILPASRISIDRSTIRSHLLSDPNDPFNRVPLKLEDVIPGKRRTTCRVERANPSDTELKAKIEAFKNERIAEKRRAMAQSEPEQMDTSTG